MSSDTVRRKHVRKASPKRRTAKKAAPKRRTAKKAAPKRRTAKKAAPKRKAVVSKVSPKKKPAFGGYAISFAGRKETVEQVFGNKPIAPSEMTKKIWAFVKSNNLTKS